MDIKWKSKILTAILVLLLCTYGLMSLVTLITREDEFLFKTYFDTEDFQYSFHDFTQQLSKYELNGMTNEEAKHKVYVTASEITEYRDQYGFEKEAKKVFNNDEFVKREIEKEKEALIDEYFQSREEDLSKLYENKKVFKYDLTDVETGETYSNIYSSNENLIDSRFKKEMAFVHEFSEKDGYLIAESPPGIKDAEKKFSGKIGFFKSSPTNLPVVNNYHSYPKNQVIFYLFIISGIIALYFCYSIIKKKRLLNEAEKLQKYYQRIPLDIGLLFFILFSVYGTFIFFIDPSQLYFYESYSIIHFVQQWLIATIFVYVLMIQIKLISNRLSDVTKVKKDWKNSIIYKIQNIIVNAFLKRSIGTQTLLYLVVPFFLVIGAAIVGTEPEYLLICLILCITVVLPMMILIMKRSGYFNRILKSTSELAQGNLEPDIKIVGKSPLAELAKSINILKNGVQSSQMEQAKSERLKTELITNVSHDLRTPLTSIITYTELLKSHELTDEEKTDYIEIIDRKSKRLKILIDDLFEASKMASGNIELMKETVDISQLLEQALAEHDETINQSSLQFRISKPESPVYAYVDGQKIWRVFDNLIGNILKYALEKTRVYISINTAGEKAIITFKNVTKYELSENTNELFERFKRGDTSRHTDGSGLGLAIAKSIIDLHEGTMDIEVDGDLFKVTIGLEQLNQRIE